MKGFKKLALVSAIAAMPMSGFAMEALDDATLSDVTGQDGIVIGLTLGQTMDILIDDTDGLDAGTGPANHTVSGGILIDNMTVTGTADIEIDAGGEGGVDGVLVVQVSLANGFAIGTGDLYAVDTNDAGDGTYTLPGATAILDSTTITFANGLDLEIQLGDGAENFMEITGNAGTISFTNFALNDISGGGAVRAASLSIGGLDLTGTTVSVDAASLVITLGAGLNNVSVTMTDLAFGDATADAIGDVYITGLNMAGDQITIAGKVSP